MRICDWSSGVCSSDLLRLGRLGLGNGLFRDGRRLTNGWFRSACNAISLERVERMQSLERARPIWPILAAVVLSFGLLVASGAARGQSQSNPTAQAVTEQQLLQELNRIQGRITIPDDKAAILQQPQGRDYQSFHEDALPWIVGSAVLGMLLLLALFYFFRGRIRTQGRDSGVMIQRFNVDRKSKSLKSSHKC